MDNATCFTQQLAAIQAIPREDVRHPKMPMDVYLQEAENLHGWCSADHPALEAAGLDWALVESLPARIGAAREAESRWFNKRFAREEAARHRQYARGGQQRRKIGAARVRQSPARAGRGRKLGVQEAGLHALLQYALGPGGDVPRLEVSLLEE